VLEQWARVVVRHRGLVLTAWALVLIAGVVASTRLTPLLGNSFAVPGTDSERARILLQQHFGERPDGTFTVVFRTHDTHGLAARLARAARAVPSGHSGPLHTAPGIVFGDVATTLDLQHAKRYTDALRRALRGQPEALVTGQPAVQADLDPVFTSDLRRGESVALPLTLLVLLILFGVSLAVVVPLVVAACTIGGALGLLYLAAQQVSMVSYVRNLVELIGLGLAVDYSLLMVHRYREELRRDPEDAVARTVATAGRAIAFSGLAVAVGLGLLLVVPVPFIRSMGIGGLLVPLVSVAAALTLQPALLSLGGRRLLGRTRGGAFWGRLARRVTARPWPVLAGGVALLLALAAPAGTLRLTPGSLTGIPASAAESVRGYDALQNALGGGLVTPTHVVIVDGDAAATKQLVRELVHDPESLVVATGTRPPYVEDDGRYRQVVVANRHAWGSGETRRYVDRVRDRLVPAARFPRGARVYAGGAPPQGVDFVRRAYGAFPWLIALVLAFTYIVLLRAFRSVVLPLKALVLNALVVAATYGVLALVFDQPIEAWIPVFLFAALFGLSMDYEVFMVSRIRESHDAGLDDRDAIASGLERTGPVVSACAAIMAIAFAGFATGRIEGLRQFGVGLVVAIVLDATVLRGLLVPAAMTVLGKRNWWLPRFLRA
jgi:putative drug exporter of the RND superfamily